MIDRHLGQGAQPSKPAAIHGQTAAFDGPDINFSQLNSRMG
jgi:hypothetical protein